LTELEKESELICFKRQDSTSRFFHALENGIYAAALTPPLRIRLLPRPEAVRCINHESSNTACSLSGQERNVEKDERQRDGANAVCAANDIASRALYTTG
jgi:hypothetical protein